MQGFQRKSLVFHLLYNNPTPHIFKNTTVLGCKRPWSARTGNRKICLSVLGINLWCASLMFCHLSIVPLISVCFMIFMMCTVANQRSQVRFLPQPSEIFTCPVWTYSQSITNNISGIFSSTFLLLVYGSKYSYVIKHNGLKYYLILDNIPIYTHSRTY